MSARVDATGAIYELGGVLYMALPRGLLAPETGDVESNQFDHQNPDTDLSGSAPSPASASSGSLAVDIDGTPTVRTSDLGLDALLKSADSTAVAPTSYLPDRSVDVRHLGNRTSGAEKTRERFTTWSQRYVVRLAVVDAFVGAAAAVVPASISDTLSDSIPRVIALGLVGAMLWPSAIAFTHGYQRRAVGVGSDEMRAVLRAFVAVVVAGAFAAVLLPGATAVQQQALLKLVMTGIPTAVVLSLGTRYVARHLLHRRQRAGESVRHVVVAGSSTAARELGERLARETQCGMTVVGVCVPFHELPVAVDMGMPVLGDLSQVAQVIRDYRCDSVAVTSDDATRFSYLRELSWSLEGSGVEMLVDPGLVEVAGPRMHIRPLMGFPLLHIEAPHFTGWRRLVKRTFDIAVTVVGGLLLSPLLVAVAVLIKLQDGGPVIFRQSRIGRGGQPFTMYKFRSMVTNAEERLAALMARNEGKGGLFKLGDDPRITRLGKFLRDFSIDELPQLLNVLNGSMSLVGPRPHLASELAAMPTEASRRALVTPGLTGLWQVSGRSDLEGADAIRLDLRYVENWSLTLDLLILWRTVFAVIGKRGAK
jgi:exopolysaccharide biosynthesis polyprenyl glycosylphosphotransferase